MKIKAKPPTNKYVQLRDLESGQCAWIESTIGDGIFDVLVMRLGHKGGIDSYVALENGFSPGLASQCHSWNCIPVDVQIVEGD